MIGKILMLISALSYSLLPLIMDISHTHILHPEWTGHARFHNVWLLGILTALGAISIFYIWSKKQPYGINLAFYIGLISLSSFFVAVITAPLYGGKLADPHGVSPIAEGVYANLIVFTASFIINFIGWLMAKKAK